MAWGIENGRTYVGGIKPYTMQKESKKKNGVYYIVDHGNMTESKRRVFRNV